MNAIVGALGLVSAGYLGCKLYNVFSGEVAKQDRVDPPKKVTRIHDTVYVDYNFPLRTCSWARKLVGGGTFTLPHRVEPPRCGCEHHAWNYYKYDDIFVLDCSRLLYHYTIGSLDTDPLTNGFTTRWRQRNIGNPDTLMYNGVDITGMKKSPPLAGLVDKHEPGCEWAAIDQELEKGSKCTCQNSLRQFDADCKYHSVSRKAWHYRMHLVALGIKCP